MAVSDYIVFLWMYTIRMYSLILSHSGGIVGQYMYPALKTIGVADTAVALGLQLGSTAVYFIFTLVGALIIDKFLRRTLIFAGLISFVLIQTAATITSWQYNLHEKKSAAVMTIV